eukprot:CAMPEP_0201739112 /NCGR_PEP_ID=MMETSP0593-20130828/45602_1 /ASSEMBLY_ACC=CAM_ASM_000672 /TAXON_ID=267983 /ORGANISM="Skeletonema japonicum, Strain CCMP2506" /LENGTH=541 /DNA_ID=CAMNT_0048233361 /DNA_START=263 /DNA_END=1888 /DNA_ORIENTATION=-
MTTLKFQQIKPTPSTNNANTTTATSSKPLARSSHGLSIIQNGSLLVLYGGEHIARTPIEDTNSSQVLWVAKKGAAAGAGGAEDWQWIVPTITGSGSAPPARVAHAQAAIGNTIYIFGGRNGIETVTVASSAAISSLSRYTATTTLLSSSSLLTTTTSNTTIHTHHPHYRKMTTLKFQQIKPTPSTNNANTTTATSSKPLARSSHGLSIIQNGSLLVLYGGEHIARTPIEDTNSSQVLWVAKKKTAEDWQWIVPTITSSSAPPARVAHAQAAVGNTIYIFGGRNGIEMGENAMNDLWMLQIDPDHNDTTATWTQIHDNTTDSTTTTTVPEARSFHKMIAIGTNLYMFGGCSPSGRMNDLWKFDTLSCQWTELGVSKVLRGRGGPNVLSLDDSKKIAIVAGFAGEETNDGHVYRISGGGGKWEEEGMKGLDEMRPRSVCCFASLPKVNKCVIFGGEVDPSAKGHEGAGGFERDVVILDGTSGSVLENIKPAVAGGDDENYWPGNRGWADATVYEDTFYIFGGLAGDDVSPIRLDDLWQCQVSP